LSGINLCQVIIAVYGHFVEMSVFIAFLDFLFLGEGLVTAVASD